MKISIPPSLNRDQAIDLLEVSLRISLENYSNVHRGSGHASIVSTRLYEKAREIIRQSLGPGNEKKQIIFSTPSGARLLTEKLKDGTFSVLSSASLGLNLGVRVIVAEPGLLSGIKGFRSGGGTAKLMAKDWVIWENAPERFEPGTPPLINIIAFARALQLERQYGREVFSPKTPANGISISDLFRDDNPGSTGKELLDHTRQTLIGAGKEVPTRAGGQPYLHFDNSASTQAPEAVWNVYRKALFMPETVQREIVEEVRSVVYGFLGASPDEYDLLFTSNTTESINLAAEQLNTGTGNETVILNTIAEHSSNDLPWRNLPGSRLIHLGLNEEGMPDLVQMEKLLKEYNSDHLHGRDRIKLVAATGASNVLGLVTDIPEMSRIAHQYGSKILIDAAQLVAHREINLNSLDVDMLAFSGHKIYAPFGTGVLLVRKGTLKLNPAELEKIMQEGEENTAGIAALGKSLLVMKQIGMKLIEEQEQGLTEKMLQGMKGINNIRLPGFNKQKTGTDRRKMGVVVFSIRGKGPKSTATQLCLQGGIGVRYGCHCAHIIVKNILGIGPRLEKFQKFILLLFPKLKLQGVVRVSLGLGNTAEDIDRLISVLQNISAGKSVVMDHSLPPEKTGTLIEDYAQAVEKRVFGK